DVRPGVVADRGEGDAAVEALRARVGERQRGDASEGAEAGAGAAGAAPPAPRGGRRGGAPPAGPAPGPPGGGAGRPRGGGGGAARRGGGGGGGGAGRRARGPASGAASVERGAVGASGLAAGFVPIDASSPATSASARASRAGRRTQADVASHARMRVRM